jgi:hypothetical protein
MTSRYRVALATLGVLSLVDVAGPLLTDGGHPPMSVALVGSAIGVASLACVLLAWRGAPRAVLPLVALRLVSAATALPAFFVADVSGVIRAFAAAFVLITLVAVATLVGHRDREAVAA